VQGAGALASELQRFRRMLAGVRHKETPTIDSGGFDYVPLAINRMYARVNWTDELISSAPLSGSPYAHITSVSEEYGKAFLVNMSQ